MEIEIIKAEQAHKDAINNMYRKYSEWNTVDPLTNKIGSLDFLIKEGKIKVLPDGTIELVKESAHYGIHEEHYFEDETLFANDIEGRSVGWVQFWQKTLSLRLILKTVCRYTMRW